MSAVRPLSQRVIEAVALVAVSVWCAQTAAAYLMPSGAAAAQQLSLAGTVVDLEVWGVAWAVAAVLVGIGTWSRLARIAGLALFVGLNVLWSASFLETWLIEGSRAWVSAKNYGLLAVLGMCIAAWTGGRGGGTCAVR